MEKIKGGYVMRKKDWILGVSISMALMIFVLMAGGCGGGSGESKFADAIYINGNIYTVDDEFSKASAVAVRGDKLLYVGDTDTASRDYRGTSTKVVDLGGKTVIPGIIENHLHFQSTGMMDPSITIDTNWQLKATILKNVEDEAKKLGPGDDKWIYSFGWNEESPYWNLDPVTFEPSAVTPPTKEDLDAAAPDNPVFLERTDGHSAWLNSLALELCGITKDTPDPSSDPNAPWIVKDENGELTGIIKETVMAGARAYVPLFGTKEGKLTMYKKAEEKFLSFGLTTVVDAGIEYADVKILDEAYKDGTLKVRAYEMLSAGDETKFISDYGKPVKDLHNGKFSVNAGKNADFVVIDRDYMTCPDAELQNITVLETYIGGELVYTRPDDSIARTHSARKLSGHPFQIRGDCPDCARLMSLAKARPLKAQ